MSDTFKIKGVDLTGGGISLYILGYTSDKKAARDYYKDNGWSLRHNYSRPFVVIEKTVV